MPDAHQATLSVPLLSCTKGEKKMEMFEGQYKDREKTHLYNHGQNRLDWREINLM